MITLYSHLIVPRCFHVSSSLNTPMKLGPEKSQLVLDHEVGSPLVSVLGL